MLDKSKEQRGGVRASLGMNNIGFLEELVAVSVLSGKTSEQIMEHLTSHSILKALSFTRAGLTWICITYISELMCREYKMLLTLGSLVKPLSNHSFTSGGASTEQTFALSTHGSLMIPTVNSFVALILAAVSLDVAPREMEMPIRGGLWVSILNQLWGVISLFRWLRRCKEV